MEENLHIFGEGGKVEFSHYKMGNTIKIAGQGRLWHGDFTH